MLPVHQTLMFSATWPPDVRKMAATYLKKAWQVSIGDKKDKLSANTSITQVIKVVEERQRSASGPHHANQWIRGARCPTERPRAGRMTELVKFLNQWTDGPGKENGVRIMVFMLYKKSTQRMADDLWRLGWNCDSVHGDKNQSARNAAVDAFKTGTCPILVATVRSHTLRPHAHACACMQPGSPVGGF
jgi:ATP-dependent RNA helicase DBP3